MGGAFIQFKAQHDQFSCCFNHVANVVRARALHLRARAIRFIGIVAVGHTQLCDINSGGTSKIYLTAHNIAAFTYNGESLIRTAIHPINTGSSCELPLAALLGLLRIYQRETALLYKLMRDHRELASLILLGNARWPRRTNFSGVNGARKLLSGLCWLIVSYFIQIAIRFIWLLVLHPDKAMR
jgi:hypothetical protein